MVFSLRFNFRITHYLNWNQRTYSLFMHINSYIYMYIHTYVYTNKCSWRQGGPKTSSITKLSRTDQQMILNAHALTWAAFINTAWVDDLHFFRDINQGKWWGFLSAVKKTHNVLCKCLHEDPELPTPQGTHCWIVTVPSETRARLLRVAAARLGASQNLRTVLCASYATVWLGATSLRRLFI